MTIKTAADVENAHELLRGLKRTEQRIQAVQQTEPTANGLWGLMQDNFLSFLSVDEQNAAAGHVHGLILHALWARHNEIETRLAAMGIEPPAEAQPKAEGESAAYDNNYTMALTDDGKRYLFENVQMQQPVPVDHMAAVHEIVGVKS